MKKTSFLFYLFIFVLAITPVFAQEKSGYKIANRISLEGDGGWDYLTIDETNGLLYVSHGTLVQVVDIKTNKQVASIYDTKGVHGITIANEFGKGYISCAKDSSVVVFELATFQVMDRVKLKAANPDAILYDPFSKNVFVFNGRSNNVSVIDAKTDDLMTSIELSGKPEFATTDEKGKIYVNIEDKGTLCVIDAKTQRVEQCWPVAPVDEPSGLAIDNATHRLFTVSDGHIAILDAQTGKVIASLPIGDRVDGVAFDSGLKRAYSANGDGTMTVVGEIKGSYKVIENMKTQKGARTIAVNSKTHHIYMPTADFGETPAASPERPKPRPSLKPNSFVILDIVPVN